MLTWLMAAIDGSLSPSRSVFPRVVATDLDGTLVRSDGTIGPRTRAALDGMRARGAIVVACTARPARWMSETALAGGLRGPAVCANGAVMWDLDAQAVLDTRPIALQSAREVVRRLRALAPAGAWAVEGVDHFGHEAHYHTRWPVPENTIVADVEALLAHPPIKLLLRVGEPPSQRLAVAAREAVADLVELTWSEPSAGLLEMSGLGVSKATALAVLCERWGVAPDDVVAFGDMPNDVAMLRWAGRGVAMGNAAVEVAQAAGEVTSSNDDEGVAAVLERLLAG
jgi:Cof subfamily protein (haloacid dehalogenase superfamily)